MFHFAKKTVNTDPSQIDLILSRGVEDVFVLQNLKEKLVSGKRLRIKLGIDPTSGNIHLGRAIPLRKLKQFQDLGHQVVLIIGDFTALIGDPSDKLEKRPMLTEAVIKNNLKTYKEQIAKIIDISKAEFLYNSTWLSKLPFVEVARLAESFTVSQMLARRNFKDRFEGNQEISLREFLYPLMQGYDSVACDADVELGGFDQLFNLKAGRIIQRFYGKKEQDVLTTQMLEGTDGRKMSSSWGNIIALNDKPEEMYGKVMSLRDDLIGRYFLLCTDVPESDVKKMIESMKQGANPKDFKILLAKEIVTLYHGAEGARKAALNFESTFSKGEMPENAPAVTVGTGGLLSDVVLAQGLVSSKSQWKRLVDEGAVVNLLNKEKITNEKFQVVQSMNIRIGSKRFIKIIIK